MSTASKIAKALESLKDGGWHTMEEIRETMKLNEAQIQQIITFLREYKFIIIDKTERKVKLDETIRQFLKQTTTSEEPSNLYKPSKKSCPFQ
jgi:transcription initiation factor IIE alpha subunit